VPRGVLRRGATTRRSRASSSRAPAGTKALGTWHATRTIQECREACGGAGYLAVNRFAALKADTDVFTTFEGDNTCCCSWSPRGCSPTTRATSRTSTSSAWSGSSPGWPSRPCRADQRAQALERVRDLLPGGDQWDQEAGLLDSDYQLAMLRFREEHILGGVAAGSSAASTRG
jgi:acyl-CoA oxidase